MRIKKILFLLPVLTLLFLFPVSHAQEEEALPSFWHAGELGKIPAVKDQGEYSSCWALTATSALEAALLPGNGTVFSADHLINRNAYTASVRDGGDYFMLMSYFSGWQGPVTEEEDPYGDESSPEGLSPAVHVQEMHLLQGADRTHIKEEVYAYGSVQTSLYMDRSTAEDATVYRAETSSYYYPEEETPNHDVLILGWDDDYPAERFAEDPGEDGAYICLNTWGSGFGEDGIFYVSYRDANIAENGISYARIEDADNYDELYQCDECGWVGQLGYGSSECWAANVYTAEGEETCAAVGFYATGEETSYDLYFVGEFEDTDSFEKMEYLQSGTFTDAGYYTVDLIDPAELSGGERFAVIVKIYTPGESNPVAAEYRADDFTQNVTTEDKESYISRSGNRWENTQEMFEANVCLKVYTRKQ